MSADGWLMDDILKRSPSHFFPLFGVVWLTLYRFDRCHVCFRVVGLVIGCGCCWLLSVVFWLSGLGWLVVDCLLVVFGCFLLGFLLLVGGCVACG